MTHEGARQTTVVAGHLPTKLPPSRPKRAVTVATSRPTWRSRLRARDGCQALRRTGGPAARTGRAGGKRALSPSADETSRPSATHRWRRNSREAAPCRKPQSRAANRRKTARGDVGRATRWEGLQENLKRERSRRWLSRGQDQNTKPIAHGSTSRPTWYGPPGAASGASEYTGGADAVRSIIRKTSRECIKLHPRQCSGGCVGSHALAQVADKGEIHLKGPCCILPIHRLKC